VDERGRQLRGDTLLILLNSYHDMLPFVLPSVGPDTSWVRLVDTIEPYVEDTRFGGDAQYPLEGRTLALFALSPERHQRRIQDAR
jgi:hypothetical protein